MPGFYSLGGLMLLSGLLGSCQRPATSARQYTPPPTPVPEAAPARPQMVFLSFKATATAGGPAAIVLLQSTVAAGQPKAAPADAADAPAYLVVRQLGPGSRVLGSATVEHPLRRTVESASPDGQLRRQDVTVPEAEFFVRMSLAPEARAVRVEEFINRQSVHSTDLTLPARP